VAVLPGAAGTRAAIRGEAGHRGPVTGGDHAIGFVGTALAAGAIVLGWLVVQVAIIGYVSWMQPVTAFGACLIMILAIGWPSLPRGLGRSRG
jgi:hypothetical protein